jgi:hypothetical protein
VITDGAQNFADAIKKEFFTINNPRTRYIDHIRLQGDHNNNKMERMNGLYLGDHSSGGVFQLTGKPVFVLLDIHHPPAFQLKAPSPYKCRPKESEETLF